MNITSQVVILSAESNKNSFEGNRQRTETLRGCLQDCNFTFKGGTGVYKGNKEDCFVVIVKNESDIQTLKDFAFKNFDQESILYQDANQEAYLHYNCGKIERLGILQEVNSSENLDSFTILNDKIYTTLPRK